MTKASGGRGARAAIVVAATALVVTLVGPSASSEPVPGLEEVHARVQELYHRAEVATDAHNAAETRIARQEKEITRLDREIERTGGKLRGLKGDAGALARAQYRTGGLPPEAQLMLSGDPETFMDDLRIARNGQRGHQQLMDNLRSTKSALDGYAADAEDTRLRLESDRREIVKSKKEIKQRLTEAKGLESRLADDEKRRLALLEEQDAQFAQAGWLNSGILEHLEGNSASAAGKLAVRYATAQLGKDYVWGAEGPDTFDCSGLTMRAWQAAGHGIPRTSQEQWRRLPRIAIRSMRPGDLIIYHRDASHVGIYVGNGSIVHAPRPGRQVTVAGAGSMAIKGVVRPDR